MNDIPKDLAITVCYRPIRALKDKSHIVTSLLREAGYRVNQVSNQRLDFKKTDIIWMLENANWFPAICKQLQTIPRGERPITLVWHSEPFPPPKSAGLPLPNLDLREIVKILLGDWMPTDAYSNYFRLRALLNEGIPDLLVVSTPGRQRFLAEKGLASTVVPLGYHPSEEGYDMGLARDIDVLFLGALNLPRRKKLFKKLRQSGTKLMTLGSWSDPNVWGEGRIQLLNRTKIFLNLQRYRGDLSDSRLILGMANRALVISEPIFEPGHFVPGKHFISATPDEMPEVIEYYLNHEDERKNFTQAGYEIVTRELTMERSIGIILELIGNHVN
jgi:hypothetical protein